MQLLLSDVKFCIRVHLPYSPPPLFISISEPLLLLFQNKLHIDVYCYKYLFDLLSFNLRQLIHLPINLLHTTQTSHDFNPLKLLCICLYPFALSRLPLSFMSPPRSSKTPKFYLIHNSSFVDTAYIQYG